MEKQRRQPTRSWFPVFRQLCNLIPNHLVPELARRHCVDEKARSSSPWARWWHCCTRSSPIPSDSTASVIRTGFMGTPVRRTLG